MRLFSNRKEGSREWMLGNFIIVLCIRVVGALATFSLNVVLARLLGADEYGIYIYTFTWVMLLGLFSGFGFEQFQTKHISVALQAGKYSEISDLIGWSRIGIAAIGIFSSSVFVVSAMLLVEDSYKFLVLSAGALSIPLTALCRSNSGTLRGLKRIVESAATLEFLRPSIQLFIVIVVYTAGVSLTALVAMEGAVVAVLFVWLVSRFWSDKYRNRLLPDGIVFEPTLALAMPGIRKWFSLTFPFILVVVLVQIQKNTDILMIGALKDTGSAGIYAVGSRVADLVVFLLVSINTLIGPIVSQLYASGSMTKLQKMITRVTQLMFAISCTVAYFVFVYSSEILTLFGADFISAMTSLRILLIAGVIKSVVGPVMLVALMTSLQRDAVRLMMVVVGINIVANYLLIPVYGMEGAAIATACSSTLWAMYMAVVVARKTGLNVTVFGVR